MSYAIGIDLGTTNSVAGVWYREAVETIIIDGRPLMPSAISVRPDGSVLVGQAAKVRSLIEPANSVLSTKRNIGDEKTFWEIQGEKYTPVDVSAIILKRIKQAAELHLGDKVNEAVITVPAYFNTNQKRDTRIAAEKAGFKVLQLLPEPTAAAISYGLDKGKDQTIMVYDLGGGTFDVSILKIKGNKFEVVAVDGDIELGGDDFDLALIKYFISIVEKKIKGNVLSNFFNSKGKKQVGGRVSLTAWHKLKEAAEKAKIELSESDKTHVMLPDVLGTTIDEVISLQTYNKLIILLVDRSINKVRSVLKAARLNPADIDRVIMVGGSTRNKLVRQKIAETIKEPYVSDRVDEVVAQGASIVAGYLSLPEEDKVPIEFQNVTPLNLGVRATKGKDKDFFKVLVPKNSPLPQKVEYEFTTVRNKQKSVDIEVFQGDDLSCKNNTLIGAFRLGGITPAPVGQPKILIGFGMDESDLLTVTATCKNIRSEKTLDVNMLNQSDVLPTSHPQADIIFWIDTSGSMRLELDGIKKSCLDFAEKVVEAGVDCRLGLMDFDMGITGPYNWEIFGPMDPLQFPSAISGLRIGRLGGVGCYIGSKATIPVTEAFADSFLDDQRLKIGILISDEVGHDDMVIPKLVDILIERQIYLHVVGVPKSCHDTLAQKTGGCFWDIKTMRKKSDFFSHLLDDIVVEITNIALK